MRRGSVLARGRPKSIMRWTSASPNTGSTRRFAMARCRDLCLWMLDLSRQGLQRRDRRNQQGQDESCYLEPLQEAAQAGRTFAEQLLQRFENEWQGDIDIAMPCHVRGDVVVSSRKLAVIMDPIESIKPHKDSSLAMLLEAQNRGWKIHYGQLHDIWLRDGEAFGRLTDSASRRRSIELVRARRGRGNAAG